MSNDKPCVMGLTRDDHGRNCEEWYNRTEETTLAIALRDGARCNNCAHQQRGNGSMARAVSGRNTKRETKEE